MGARWAFGLVLVGCAVGAGRAAPLLQSADLAALQRASAARPTDVDSHRKLAQAYEAAGRLMDAVTEWRRVTELAPTVASGWYALGHAYNAVAQEAIRTFDDRPEEHAWRQLLIADGLLANGHLTDAFALFRASLEQLPLMATIHDSLARVYERTGHVAWAGRERARGTVSSADCVKRRPLCDFRAGRALTVLTATALANDPESRYLRARAANDLAVAAFTQLESLADSPERRAVRATVARAEERHHDAIAELTAALKLAPGNPALIFDLASAYYATRDYEQTVAVLAPLLRARPDDVRLLKLSGYSYLHLRRVDEAMPLLQRASERDLTDSGPRLALGRAHLHNGDFAAAIPLIEPHVSDDQDGSLHVQLARAYAGVGQKDKAAALLTRSLELHRASEERKAAAAQRRITEPASR